MRFALTRDDMVPRLQAVGLLQRNGEHTSIAESDHLGPDGASGPGGHFAKVANGNRWSARADHLPHHFHNLSYSGKEIDVLQLIKERPEG